MLLRGEAEPEVLSGVRWEVDSYAPSNWKAELGVWLNNSGVEAVGSKFPACIWKTLDRMWLCEVLGDMSLWWVFVIAWQVTECWKLLVAAGGVWSHIVLLSAWLEGLRLMPVCLILCDINVACFSSASHCALSVSDSVSLSHSLALFPFLFLVWLCAHVHVHVLMFYMIIFPSTLWNLGVCVLAWGFTCIRVSRWC